MPTSSFNSRIIASLVDSSFLHLRLEDTSEVDKCVLPKGSDGYDLE